MTQKHRGAVPQLKGIKGKSRIRLATKNCCSLEVVGRLNVLLEEAKDADIDIFCLQETRVGLHNRPALEREARKYGYDVLWGVHHTDWAGKRSRTLMTLTRWPMTQVKQQENIWSTHRVQLFKVHRSDRPAFNLANVHCPNDSQMATQLLNEVERHQVRIGGQGIIIGDFNCEPDERPVVERHPRYECCDEGNEIDIPTRRQGDSTPRHIDYAIATIGLKVKRGEQCSSFSDHDRVTYDIAASPLGVTWKRPKRATEE